jgi:E3 ubiquitin-protein ligase MYCBP2
MSPDFPMPRYQIHVTIDGCDMGETYKVEVKDPPQGMAPPHPGGSGTKKTGSDRGGNRLRKFVAKPSAGLRIRIHPTLQSEQVNANASFRIRLDPNRPKDVAGA